jgi:hypothetical protein
MLASRPLAAKMYASFDQCYDRYHNAFGGDEMISRCAAFAGGKTKQTITTMEKGMHRESSFPFPPATSEADNRFRRPQNSTSLVIPLVSSRAAFPSSACTTSWRRAGFVFSSSLLLLPTHPTPS